MVKLPRQDYYNMTQLSNEWGSDPNQLLQTLKKHAARLWIYINNKTCRINHTPIGLFEAPANTLKDEDFFRLAKLTNKKLVAEGFSITQLPDKGTILAKKGTEEILIHRSKKKHYVSIPNYKSNAIEIRHDGFIELRPEFLTDIKINISNLFNGSETYIVTVKCVKQGFIRFLHPAVFIKLTDLYITHNEFERLNAILYKRELETLPYIRETNRLKRSDQITALFNKICIEYPIRIDINKINHAIQSINLAWILAFCRMGYNSFGEVKYKDMALCSMANDLRKILTDKLQTSGALANLNAKYYDEVDMATGFTVTKTLSHNITPDVAIALLRDDTTLNKFIAEGNLEPRSLAVRNNVTTNLITDNINKVDITDKTHTDNTHITDKSKQKNVPNARKKPSEKGAIKSEIIRLELEIILTESPPGHINEHTLWEALLTRAKNKSQSKLEIEKGILREKDTGTVWDKEKASYHIKTVIKWYNSQK